MPKSSYGPKYIEGYDPYFLGYYDDFDRWDWEYEFETDQGTDDYDEGDELIYYD